MPQGTDVLGSLTFGMLQMPKLNEIPPGRAGGREARGEGRWPGQTGPEAASLEWRAQGQAGGARTPWDSWGNSRLPTQPGPGWSRCPASLLCALSFQKSTMESKDEVSDTDSGIILQSGPDSPVSPMKELTHAVHKQQRALEARLEACLEELRRLCLREAELTGTLPAEYPLKPGEKAPKVRRRIGAAYKLDDWALHREDPLSSLERQLALQLQITEAARRLCLEENLSRQARRQRKHSMLQEEKKLQELQRCLVERRRNSEPPPAAALPLGRELSASDDSSLSDGLLLEEEESQVPKPPPESPAPPSRPLPPQTLEGLQPTGPEPGGPERVPVQNSPWKETSLDHPYEKPRKSSEPWSESSPVTTPQDGPSASSLWLLEPASYHVVPIRGVPGQWQGRTSAPATPEMQGRRGQSQSLRVDSFRAGPEGRGRSAFPRRRPTHYTVTVPDSCFPATKPPLPHAACHSCSEDSGSDVSSISHPTSPGSSSPDISFLQPLSPPKNHRHRGAWVPAGSRELVAHHPKLLLPPGYFPAGRYVVVAESPLPPGEWELCRAAPGPAYEEEATPLRYQRLVPSRSRIVRTPSLKDSPAGRGLSKAAVSEELKWWHERARLRSTRPHSLDRQGAFRVRSLPLGREGFGRALGPRAQVPTVCVLRRSPDGAPVQVFVPEKGEIISQV
ncbi:innate immunity activator protein isoform X1 [Symphalangus syndactylus]|uniref:innate immunity activator protein isoform X1 n=1 Tax=Symphalangus syndactylus TaxID=9590 RepID=UPI0030053476